MGNEDRLNRILARLLADARTRPGPPTSLTEAALRNDLAAIDAFLDGGADIDERTIGFVSPLAAAAGRGNLAAARRLIDRGASLDPPGALFPVFAFAVMHRHLDVLELGLRAGAPVAQYRTLMLEMANRGAWDVVDALLAGGADPQWLDPRQRRALDEFVREHAPRSVEYRARLADAIRAAQAQAAMPSQRDRLADTERARLEAEAVASVRATPGLAQARSDHGTPVLALAAEAGAQALIDALLQAGAPADPPMTGPSPLLRALRRADFECVHRLLAAGANPNAGGAWSAHPLIDAARAGSLACVRALVDAGALAKAPVRKAVREGARGTQASQIVELIDALPARAPRLNKARGSA